MDKHSPALFFEVFNEIGIIEQLSRAILEARLPDGLIAPHFAVISHLTRVEDGRTPIEIARAFQVPKTSMTHTIKVLEKHGLVEVRPNPQDGRSKRVWLTEKGKRFRDETINQLAPEFGELAQGFDMDALIAIKPTLTDLRVYLDNHRNPSKG